MAIPAPDVRSLLPPLLACLPTAFASSRPPPALFPLLSPILRQRVQLISASAQASTGSWLPLLCWMTDTAEILPSIVEGEAFELHPVSGEIEYGEVDPTLYKRLDEETLQAKVDAADLALSIVFVWIQDDKEASGPCWKVGEVRPLKTEGGHGSQGWWPTITQADSKANEALRLQNNNGLKRRATNGDSANEATDSKNEGENNDDDYWAQYDNIPSTTPANPSPMPRLAPSTQNRGRSASEAAYFEQYSEIQPEMDNDDPSQDCAGIGQSTLSGNTLYGSMNQGGLGLTNGEYFNNADKYATSASKVFNSDKAGAAARESNSGVDTSISSSSAVETAIKQHVSTSVKSLFRLCRNAGIERSEFEDLVHTELETLSLLAEDD